MARDFLTDTAPFASLQEREKRKYSVVMMYLNREYMLRRGDASFIAERLGCSPQTVMLTARVIRRVAALYHQHEPTVSETLERAALGDWESLKAISLYDHTLKDIEVDAIRDTAATTVLPTKSAPVTPLEERIEVMPAWVAGEDTMPQLSALSYTHGHTVAATERRKQFLTSSRLPRRTVVSGKRTHVEYRPAFQKAYRRLSTTDAESVRSSIAELTTYGYRHTRESQKHRKLPLNREWAPKGSYVSRVKLKLRYVWGYERNETNDRWHLVVYYVGTHDKVWASEK